MRAPHRKHLMRLSSVRFAAQALAIEYLTDQAVYNCSLPVVSMAQSDRLADHNMAPWAPVVPVAAWKSLQHLIYHPRVATIHPLVAALAQLVLLH